MDLSRLLLVCALVGCGGSTPTAAPPPSNEAPPPVATQPPREAEEALADEPPYVLADPNAGMTATGIPECDLYQRKILQFATCEKLPEASRAAMRESLAQTAAAWKDLPPDAHSQVAQSCTAATEALAQALTSTGC